MAFTIDTQTMQLMSMLSKMIRVPIKDTFVDDHDVQVIVVNQGLRMKAVGPKGAHVKKVELKTKKKVKVIEHNEDLITFIKNVIYPLECDIKERNNIVTFTPRDLKTRGQLIGRAANRLRNTEKIVQRYFPIKRMMVTQVQETYQVN